MKDAGQALMIGHISSRTTAGKKSLVCMECAQDFSVKSHLIKRKRTHSGEKPSVCGECWCDFIQKSHLSRHQRAYTGQKLSVSECVISNKLHLDSPRTNVATTALIPQALRGIQRGPPDSLTSAKVNE